MYTCIKFFNACFSIVNIVCNYLFSTFRASERCHQEKRKTINGEDILFAMSTLGFDNYVDPLKCYLQKYREVSEFIFMLYLFFNICIRPRNMTVWTS